MAQTDVLVTPFFKTIPVEDPKASKLAGRPIFRDDEFVEVRVAGERNYAPVFPAAQMWKRVDGVEVSYAERWSEQYRRFKENNTQIASGTPLSELPFLSQAKQAELRAFKIYTAEALAALDGKNLKTLGMDGRKWKDQAAAYLDKALKGAGTAVLLDEINDLRARLLRFEGMQVPTDDGTVVPVPEQPIDPDVLAESAFATFSFEDLKAFIESETGSKPRGNPSHVSLIRMAEEIEATKAEAA